MPYVPYRRHRRQPAARKPAAKPAARRRTPAVKTAVKSKPAVRRFISAGPANVSQAGRAGAMVSSALHSSVALRSGRENWSYHSHRGENNSGRFDVAGAQTGFPLRKFVKFLYQDWQVVTQAAGAVAQYTYRLNGLQDPDVTGAGHQPRYYDTYLGATEGNAPYAQYRVHACKFTLTFTNFTATGDQAIIYAHWRDASDSPITDYFDLGEVPQTVSAVAGSGNSQGSISLSRYVKMNSILGFGELQDTDSTAAYYNALPTDQVFVDFGYLPLITVGDASFNVRVELEYYVELFDLNLINNS